MRFKLPCKAKNKSATSQFSESIICLKWKIPKAFGTIFGALLRIGF